MVVKKIFTVILLSLFIFVVGCSEAGTGDADTGTSPPVTGGAFIGGNSGLAMSFLTGAPPDEVFDTNYPFSINLKIQNIGEWDVAAADAKVRITGINPADFNVLASDLSISPLPEELLGAQRDPVGNVIQGTITNLEFNNLQYVDEVSGSVQFNIRAEACYDYGTNAQSQLCIKNDFLGMTGEDGVCDANSAKPAENSGGLVHIEGLTQSVMSKNKISFTFNVKHVGKGKVYKKSTMCSSDLSDKDKVYVKITDPGIGGSTLSCNGLSGGATSYEGETTLYTGERSIRCTLDIPDADLGDFEKVLNVELTYGYKEYTDTAIVVKHAIN